MSLKLYAVLVLLLISFDCNSQDKSYTVDTIIVKSEILNENRTLILYKPCAVSKGDSVRYIYLIDGEFSNCRYQQVKERFNDSISDLIAVGIVNTNRNRDLLYVNGADKFLHFLTSELIPVVEKDYKTQERILFGHSFGGGFTVYSMINKPNYFNRYIASSPTPIMGLIKKENYQQIDSLCNRKVAFYWSFGSKDMGQVRKWSLRLKDNLTGITFKNFEWNFKIFEGKNHNNSDISALINGLF
jgi:enterochelin esterase-like enzyme